MALNGSQDSEKAVQASGETRDVFIVSQWIRYSARNEKPSAMFSCMLTFCCSCESVGTVGRKVHGGDQKV